MEVIHKHEDLTFLVRGLGRLRVGEGVGDLEEQKSGGDEADGIGLKWATLINTYKNKYQSHPPDPALLQVPLERELHDHGSEGVGVGQLSHRGQFLKLL